MRTDSLKTGRFTRKDRVKRSDDIRRLFKNGQKTGLKGARLFFLENGLERNRIAFVLPRGYGNAVQRNRSKRLSREAYRKYKAHLNTGYDMLLLIYPGNDSFSTRCDTVYSLLKNAGILSE